MSNAKLRWGILGTAQIARKNWRAILNTGNAVVTAVASRDVECSRRFIQECQSEAPFENVPAALGSYAELLVSQDVDAVYIPLPTGLRKEWGVRAAEVGKHVLCEKPCGRSVAEVREMVEACRRNRVQFMDGVMFMHSRRLKQIRGVLDDSASVGEVKRITCAFSFFAPEDFLRANIRMHSELEPFGCLGDLGWYCIRFALWVMNGRLPRQVTGRILSQQSGSRSPSPVPTEFSAELLFDGGVSTGLYCSFVAEHQQWVNVSGTRGYLHVHDFVLPFSGGELAFEVHSNMFRINGCDFSMEAHPRRFTVAEHSHGHPTAQETNMFRNFADQVRSSQFNDVWPEIALKTQQVMNACFDSAHSGSRSISLL
jgi:predicted dehydrogenase